MLFGAGSSRNVVGATRPFVDIVEGDFSQQFIRHKSYNICV